MNRIWTQKEIEFLHDNFGKLDLKEMSLKLNRTLDAVKIKYYRLGIKKLKSLEKHNYFSEIDLYNEVKKLKYISTPVYKFLIDNDIIKTYGNKFENKLLTMEEYDKWIKFFKNNIPAYYVKSQIETKYKGVFEKWLSNGIIKSSTPCPNKKIYKYWINKKEYDFVIDIFNNYIRTKELGNKVGYTKSYIIDLINSEVIKNYKRINKIFWVHKSEIINLKIRIKKLNAGD